MEEVIAIMLLKMFHFNFMIVAFLYMVIESPELWVDAIRDHDDDDDEILVFYHTLMMGFLNSNILFLKLCEIFDIYSTRPSDLLFQFGNYPRE